MQFPLALALVSFVEGLTHADARQLHPSGYRIVWKPVDNGETAIDNLPGRLAIRVMWLVCRLSAALMC
jgi:hypothetical protein